MSNAFHKKLGRSPPQLHAILTDAPDTSKPTNPKQAFADTKPPIAVGPEVIGLWDCLGYLEGALKYGRGNWRGCGVRITTYVDAAKRHILKFAEGEWCDPETQVPHLASARACLGIILDAYTLSAYPVRESPKRVGGKFLTDDRMPSVDVAAVEAETTRIANHLRELFKDRTPKHWTIDDTHVEPLLPLLEVPPLTLGAITIELTELGKLAAGLGFDMKTKLTARKPLNRRKR